MEQTFSQLLYLNATSKWLKSEFLLLLEIVLLPSLPTFSLPLPLYLPSLGDIGSYIYF